MKEDKQTHLHHHNLRRVAMFSGKKHSRSIAYLLLLALSFALGYFSASSPHTPTKTPQSPIQTTATPTATSTATTTTTTSIPLPEPEHLRFSTRCADPLPSKLVRQTILNRVFNGTSPFRRFPPKHIAPLLKPKRVKGWGSTGPVFETLIRKVKPRTIVEVGTFLGASTIHMAELTSRLGLKTQILCVDDFRGWPGFLDRFGDIGMVNGDVTLLYQFMQNAVHFNVSDSVLPVPFSTGSGLDKLCEWGVLADLVEVDAGHDFHSAWSDINRAYKILRPGGIMFGHDYFTAADDRGVRRAVNLFARVKGLQVRPDGQHWVIGSA